jgi:EAL domain-containing protein (putative c-di-GMP-specific phosphodiesterase class I)
MYAAKKNGESHAFYAPGQNRVNTDTLILVGELRHAIERGELDVHYQPKVALRTGSITSVEALVRWNHPSRGSLAPAEFVPLAEQTGLIKPLTWFVLREALLQQRRWRSTGFTPSVAVNISVRSLGDASLEEHVRSLLREFAVAPAGLVLEITESAVIQDPTRARLVLGRLSQLGVRIALDDFGTGYSSLEHLGRLPLDQIKIDRSFVTNAASEPTCAAIVRSMVNLAHELGLEVVAEGVETKDVWELLRSLGGDDAQGFYVSHPVPAEELTRLLEHGPGVRPGFVV